MSLGSITPSSYSNPERNNGVDCSSTWATAKSRIAARSDSLIGVPREAAAPEATVVTTSANCSEPMTAHFALGQVNRNLGSNARPHMP